MDHHHRGHNAGNPYRTVKPGRKKYIKPAQNPGNDLQVPAGYPDRGPRKIQDDLFEPVPERASGPAVINQNVPMLGSQALHGQKDLMDIMIHPDLLVADPAVKDPYVQRFFFHWEGRIVRPRIKVKRDFSALIFKLIKP
jgi:hypothetical protein